MFGKLAKEQIEEVLHQQIFGHLGCHADGITYVVPISYAYDGNYIYGHSRKGMKTEMMKKNPNVCFQVDILENMANWKSVIAWGQYEELKDPAARDQALKVLLQRHSPFIASQTLHISAEWPFSPEHLESIGGLVFRIQVTQKTGRFEQSSAAVSLPAG